MDVVRTIVSGSVGKVGWLVPVMLVLIGWRNIADPERDRPGGRQVIGWLALAFGSLGIVHLADGNPQPELGDATQLQFEQRGDISFVVSSLLLDLLRSVYVVVPLLALVAFFGVLSSSPPRPSTRFRSGWPGDATRCSDGRRRRRRRSGDPAVPHPPRRDRADDVDPGDQRPAYDSPVLAERELREESSTARPARSSTTTAAAAPGGPRRRARPTSSRRRTRRSRGAWSGSRCPATS